MLGWVAQIKRRDFTFLLVTNERIMRSFVTSKNVNLRNFMIFWHTAMYTNTGQLLRGRGKA